MKDYHEFLAETLIDKETLQNRIIEIGDEIFDNCLARESSITQQLHCWREKVQRQQHPGMTTYPEGRTVISRSKYARLS